MPNPNTLEWLHYQDIQIPDVVLRQQFRQYMETGQYAEALAILSNNGNQLKGKAYIADTINKIISGVINLQERYNTGVTVYLSDLAIQYNVLIDNLRKRGNWQSNIQYTPYNFVIYDENIYMCFQKPPLGTLPTDTTYWLFLGLRGSVGVPGTNVNMRYNWDAGTPYELNDLVVYNGNIYCAKNANTNVVPTDSNTWVLFLAVGEGKINVGVTPPEKPARDMIWFQTQSDPNTATTNDPIIGIFKKYNKDTESWDDMYPETLFTLIENTENFLQSLNQIETNISWKEWDENLEFSYTIDTSNVSNISIFPGQGMFNPSFPSGVRELMYYYYNYLSLKEINENGIVFKIGIRPTLGYIPICIQLQ